MSTLSNIPKQSYFSETLDSPIDASQTTNIILTDVPEYAPAGETVYFNILDPDNPETISATGWSSSTNILSGVTRGVDTYTGEGASGVAHAAGVEIVLSDDWNLFNDIATAVNTKFDTAGGTFTGAVDFTADDQTVTFKIPNITTTNRDLMTPANGMLIYNTTTGTFQFYDGGAWNDVGTATVNNASETVAGVIELATNAEMGTGTTTGGTGARLVAPNDQLVKTSSGAGDENKIAVLDSAGKFAIGFIDATATPTASKIPIADGSGVLDNGWLNFDTQKFGGDGSDGALDTSGGIVDIDAGGARVVVKNYTTMNVASNALTFSNTHANGTVFVLKASGNVTISDTINLDGAGSAGGTGGTGSDAAGQDGTPADNWQVITQDGAEIEGQNGIHDSAGGAGGVKQFTTQGHYMSYAAKPGSGGGGGGSGSHADATGGAGGAGGGALLLECGGALNFTGTITADGIIGTVGILGGSQNAGGGGGGGAGGTVQVFYNTLTSKAGTITATGGAGGEGGGGGGVAEGGSGGGGAGSAVSAGGAGGAASSGAASNGSAADIGGAGGVRGGTTADGGGGGGGASGWYAVVPYINPAS